MVIMHRSLRILLIAGVLVAMAGGFAQAQSPRDPASTAAAKRLIEVLNVERNARARLPDIVRGTFKAFKEKNPGRDAETLKVMEEIFLPEFTLRLPEFIDAMAELYALHYTTAEMGALTAFFSTPVGQKFFEKLPILTQQGAKIGGVWGERIGREVMEKNADRIRGRGLRI